MKTSESFRDYVLDQLHELEPLTCKRMFGGYGLYKGATFFGILYRDKLYFKVSDRTRPAYEKRGMKPFRPSAKQTLTSYYEVPPDILDARAEVVEWARRAIDAAAAAKVGPPTLKPNQTPAPRRAPPPRS